MSNYIEVTCPFCGESDFDRYGLKNHLESGWCEVYERTTPENYDGDPEYTCKEPPACPFCGDRMKLGTSGMWECDKGDDLCEDDDDPTPF